MLADGLRRCHDWPCCSRSTDFCRILSGECELSFDDWLSVIDRHIRDRLPDFGRYRDSPAAWLDCCYVHGVRSAAALRAKLMRATTRSDMNRSGEVLPDSPSESERNHFCAEHGDY